MRIAVFLTETMAMVLKPIQKYKYAFYIGGLLATLLFLLKWFQLRLLIVNNSMEFYILSVAVLFTAAGSWMGLKLSKPKVKTIVVEKEIIIERTPEPGINQNAIESLNLSKRELEILQLMAEGLTNNEIGERLFLSVNTIKTHLSRIFEKLDVTRRTQAVDKAKKLRILA